MSYNGSGLFLINSTGQPVVADTLIEASVFNAFTADVGTGLSNVICKDGQTTVTANLPMAGFRHTGVGNAVSDSDYMAFGQGKTLIQNDTYTWCGTAGGTADALTLTPTPAISAYVAGQKFRFKSGASANTGATTVAVSGLSAIAVQLNGAALAAGDIEISQWYEITLSDTSTAQLQKTGIPNSVVDKGAVTSSGLTMATSRILGRTTASTGAIEEVSVGSGLTLTGGVLDAVAQSSVPVPQTVLSGPVDSSGFPDFGGTTGSATLTLSGTLKATAAAGVGQDYTGSITNPAFTSPAGNGTGYLMLGITSAGVVTASVRTLAPNYQWGGTYSTTNDQLTFNIQEMTMKAGNGSVATQVYEVCIGKCAHTSGAWSGTPTYYALMGQAVSPSITLPSINTPQSWAHNIGWPPELLNWEISCEMLAAVANWSIGDIHDGLSTSNITTGANGRSVKHLKTSEIVQICSATNGWLVPDKSTGATTQLASSSHAATIQRVSRCFK